MRRIKLIGLEYVITHDNKQNMRKLSMDLNGLHLRNLQIISENNSKRTHRGPNSNRTLMKLFLTKEILEECLETIDIFKEIMEDPVQKNKLMRDVTKNIKLKLYDEEGSIYDKGDVSQSIYLVIKGEVSLCLPMIKQTEIEDLQKDDHKDVQYDYKEIDIYRQGVGFGQAEFIHGKKRGLTAKAKQDDTVVGSINADGFEQIIELYRQRVYYKKIQMFNKCALLRNLQPYQLQFIVNNAKPFTFPISKQITSMGEKPKALYLITNGQIELNRDQISRNQSPKRKTLKYDEKNNSIILKKVVVGVLQEGQFFGDCELALNTEFTCNAVCKSQKVKMWICDERIIMSQIAPEMLEIVKEHYLNKNEYRERKIAVYKSAKSKIQREMQDFKDIVLNQNQMKIKRKINNRYVEKTPSLIGHLSPREIKKIVDLKYAKLKTQHSKIEDDQNVFPLPPLNKSCHKKLARNQRAISPLLKKLKQSRNIDQRQSKQKLMFYSPIQNSVSVKLGYVRYQNENVWAKSQHSSTKPLLVLMKPFHKKVKSLHQRLTRQFNQARNRKRAQLQQIKKIKDEHGLSISQMKRLAEFISKIQSQNKASI